MGGFLGLALKSRVQEVAVPAPAPESSLSSQETKGAFTSSDSRVREGLERLENLKKSAPPAEDSEVHRALLAAPKKLIAIALHTMLLDQTTDFHNALIQTTDVMVSQSDQNVRDFVASKFLAKFPEGKLSLVAALKLRGVEWEPDDSEPGVAIEPSRETVTR